MQCSTTSRWAADGGRLRHRPRLRFIIIISYRCPRRPLEFEAVWPSPSLSNEIFFNFFFHSLALSRSHTHPMNNSSFLSRTVSLSLLLSRLPMNRDKNQKPDYPRRRRRHRTSKVGSLTIISILRQWRVFGTRARTLRNVVSYNIQVWSNSTHSMNEYVVGSKRKLCHTSS